MNPWHVRRATVLCGFLVTLAYASWIAAQGVSLKSDSKVKVAIKTQKSADDKSETVTITLTIEKGWHLYANPVGLEDLVSSQTVVTFDGKPKPEVVKIDYPLGKLVKDAVIGDHKTYEDQVTIKAEVRRGDSGPMTVAVKVQACSDKTCLQPATIKTTLP